MSSDRFDSEQMFGWIRDQVSMGARRAGSAADRQNEDYIEAHLRDFGLEKVRREPIPITHWAAETHSVEIDDGSGFEQVDSFPIPYSAFTAPEGREARLVFADPATLWHRADWKGAIVVTEIGFPDLDVKLLRKFSLGQYDPDGSLDLVKHPATWVRLGWHLYHLAAKRGAVGFIGIVKDQPGGSCHMYAPYGFREKDILDKPIPGFWVGRADASWLRKAAESGHGKARLSLAGIREPGTMHNIVGEIPGSSEETIVLTCHHDSPFASPVEDASGVAVVLALARHFAQQRGLERRLVVVLTAGHFYGSLGTRTFIETHRDDVVKHTALEITIEHIALEAIEDDQQRLVPTGLPEAAGVFVPMNRTVTGLLLDAAKTHELSRTVLLPAEGPLGDYPPTDGGDWYAAGVPVVNYITNPVYLLTDDDAFEFVAKDRLSKVAGTFADFIESIDSVPRDAISAVDSQRYKYAMKLLKHVSRAKTTFFGIKPVY